MKKITSSAELTASIKELEAITKRQEEDLKIEAKSTAKTLKPIPLIRMGVNTLAVAAGTPDIRKTTLNTFIGLAAGFISRKLVVGKSTNIFRRTLGAAFQAAIIRLFYRKLPDWERKAIKMLPSTTSTAVRVKRLKY